MTWEQALPTPTAAPGQPLTSPGFLDRSCRILHAAGVSVFVSFSPLLVTHQPCWGQHAPPTDPQGSGIWGDRGKLPQSVFGVFSG